MNIKQMKHIKHILTAASIAVATSGAVASEATQFTHLGGDMSRAQVNAALAQARASGALDGATELYGSYEPQVSGERSRDAVRAEARLAAHRNRFNPLYSGA